MAKPQQSWQSERVVCGEETETHGIAHPTERHGTHTHPRRSATAEREAARASERFTHSSTSRATTRATDKYGNLNILYKSVRSDLSPGYHASGVPPIPTAASTMSEERREPSLHTDTRQTASLAARLGSPPFCLCVGVKYLLSCVSLCGVCA